MAQLNTDNMNTHITGHCFIWINSSHMFRPTISRDTKTRHHCLLPGPSLGPPQNGAGVLSVDRPGGRPLACARPGGRAWVQVPGPSNPTGVSLAGLPHTTGRPFGFQTGHPDRRILVPKCTKSPGCWQHLSASSLGDQSLGVGSSGALVRWISYGLHGTKRQGWMVTMWGNTTIINHPVPAPSIEHVTNADP